MAPSQVWRDKQTYSCIVQLVTLKRVILGNENSHFRIG